MARNKAFTLVEFLTGTAVVALLGAVIAPITAQARQTARKASTASNLRAVGLAATQYAADYNGATILTQQSDAASDKVWSVLLQPYLPCHTAYFDPTRTVLGDTVNSTSVAGVTLPWYSVTSLSINDSGYTGRWGTMGGTCAGRRINYTYGQRNLSTMSDPNKRVAFAPTTYGGTTLGWTFFHSYDASWYKPTIAGTLFSWNNMVYNTQSLYSNKLIPVARADGSAGTLNPATDFMNYSSAPTAAKYCAWMSTTGKSTWGASWDSF